MAPYFEKLDLLSRVCSAVPAGPISFNKSDIVLTVSVNAQWSVPTQNLSIQVEMLDLEEEEEQPVPVQRTQRRQETEEERRERKAKERRTRR
jgi:hypothetical protein